MGPRQPTFAPAIYQAKTIPRSPFNGSKSTSALVVGAGVFGIWTALHLLRSGLKVTLIDTWGPGNSRSSSGGETRLMRFFYGGNPLFFNLASRALDLWRESQDLIDRQIFFPKEIMWFLHEPENQFIKDSLSLYDRHQLKYEILPAARAVKAFPRINFDDIHEVVVDREGGFLNARESCGLILNLFVREGGSYLQDQVLPGGMSKNKLSNLTLADGSKLEADLYVFAIGPWLKTLFPELLKDTITCTQQEVFYLGSPAGASLDLESLPCWVDWNEEDIYYGIPGHENRGFKIAHDQRGEEFDPSFSDRIPNQEELYKAKTFLTHRFPDFMNAPLVESRVCQYASTTDGNLILDHHPEAMNLWLIGGGSGHGFKHGPAIGELACRVIQGERDPEPAFRLDRQL